MQTFWVKEQWIKAVRKDILGAIFLIGVGIYVVQSIISGILYLGINYYFKARLSDLFWLAVRWAILISWVIHIKKVFQTNAELFEKGFYLKMGSKEYAYEFKDINHIQKTFMRGNNNTITTVILTLHLKADEKIVINGSGSEVMITFAEALALHYAETKKIATFEAFKIGEKIWFGSIDMDKNFLYYNEQQFSRSDILEIKKARTDRFIIVYDQAKKKLAKLDQNHILDEKLFEMLLSEVGKSIN